MSIPEKPLIGFIGQGFVGKNTADDFEERGYEVVRYALEAPYVANKDAIALSDVVFVAVPTPTTPEGFSDKALRAVLPLVGKGKTVVIKSTILPGTTNRLQEDFADIYVLHSPEFLREKTAREDTKQPPRNIVGIPLQTSGYRELGEHILALLPPAAYQMVCTAREAELIKYGGNSFLATKVVFMNLMYDLAQAAGADYEAIAEAMAADERIGKSHMNVVDSSGHNANVRGRGAGGHCFPKDLAALIEHSTRVFGSTSGQTSLLRAVEAYNLELLHNSEKDLDLLEEIYGKRLSLDRCRA